MSCCRHEVLSYPRIQSHDLQMISNQILRIFDFNTTQNGRYQHEEECPGLLGKTEGSQIVVFVASLHCYDEFISIYNWPNMDIEMNCMERQMERFDDLLNRIPIWFSNTNLVLLLNKKDLFVEKIRKHPINTCPLFADYDGPMDSVEQSIEYIRNVFLSRT